MRKTKVVIGYLGTQLDSGKGAGRWEKWRPTVSLVQHEDVAIERLELLYTPQHRELAHQVRKQRRRRRDYRRNEPLDRDDRAAARDRSPSQQVAAEELLREFRRRLSAEERELADRRSQGLGWAEIATELGGTPEGRRKQLARAVERVSQELGLDEMGEA